MLWIVLIGGHFDDFNPQFNAQKMALTVCGVCKKFFPTKVLLEKHKKTQKKKKKKEEIEIEIIIIIITIILIF